MKAEHCSDAFTSRGRSKMANNPQKMGQGASGAESLSRESPTGEVRVYRDASGPSSSSSVGHHLRHTHFSPCPEHEGDGHGWVGGGSWGHSNWSFKLIKEMPLTTWGSILLILHGRQQEGHHELLGTPPLQTPQLAPGQR